LTIVPEGEVRRLTGRRDGPDAPGRRVRLVADGSGWVSSEAVSETLSGLVDSVLTRLAEAGLPKTRLAEEWAAVNSSDNDIEFCRAVARLGIDPYAVDDEIADAVVGIANELPEALLGDFFDSADPTSLQVAAEWTTRAIPRAQQLALSSRQPLAPLRKAVTGPTPASGPPWTVGYLMAQRLRAALSTPDDARVDVAAWVSADAATGQSGGLSGVTAVNQDRCGLLLGTGRPNTAFTRARALGRTLGQPERSTFVLSKARGYDERVAGAFAAELLAPAAGIRAMLEDLGADDDEALDAVAGQFGVSALVVRHQYDNQIGGGW
jgi:hypothetical protein